MTEQQEPKRTLSDDEARRPLTPEEIKEFEGSMPPIVVVNNSGRALTKSKFTLKSFAWGLALLLAYTLAYAALLAWLGSEIYSNLTGHEMSFERALNYVILLALAGRAFDLLKIRDRKI